MARLTITWALILLGLAGCSGWAVQPMPYAPATLNATRTPSIYTATPVILAPPVTSTASATSGSPIPPTNTFTPSPTSSPTATIETVTATKVTPTPTAQIRTEILGCNTSIDITHGMGEVTNAFVTISNTGPAELTDVCATLRGLDEGRPHPDKTKCVASLAANYQVTLKLTIDTTYKEVTPIQVDIASDENLLQRVGMDSCTDIGLFPPGIDDLGVPKPIP